jgi:orotidine-5'-phosphate decarboxylase
MNYIELLKNSADKFSSIVCFGMDPVIEEYPRERTGNGEIIFKFYENILNELIKKNILPGAVNPNYAFYAQYGLEGIATLEKLIKIYKSAGIPVILDTKEATLAKQLLPIAVRPFDFFDADAVTLSPYLGYDSIEPYIKGFPERAIIYLQNIQFKLRPIAGSLKLIIKNYFSMWAELIIQWYHPGIGSVAGATYPEQLSQISNIFENQEKRFLSLYQEWALREGAFRR